MSLENRQRYRGVATDILLTASYYWCAITMSTIGRRDAEMQAFWTTLPSKLKTLLYDCERRLVLSSEEVSLQPLAPCRVKSIPKYYLFNDCFVIVQGSTLIDYPLDWIWVEHIIEQQHNPQHMSSFRLVLPETTIDLVCKEFTHKSKWVSFFAEAIGNALNLPQFIGRGDLSLDTQLELLRGREYMEYKYQSLPDYKDGCYKGQWMNGKPHGCGEFWHEPSGRLYKGRFREGKFHGQGELLWFTDSESRKKYIGEFRNGDMFGQGEMKYSNGDVYAGCWADGMRSGFGRLEEASKKNSVYSGGWLMDKKHGYGIYDNKMKHERYLGMWADNNQNGPGVLVTSTGTYCEANFYNGIVASGNDGLILDPNGSSYMGKVGPDFKLTGKGTLTLTNGVMIEGHFSGSWLRKIEIQRGSIGQDEEESDSMYESARRDSELQIAKLDKRIGNCTVLASNKWQPIYEECEAMLGFTGNAASDVFTAWSRIAAHAYERRERLFSSAHSSPMLCNPMRPLRRTSSLNTVTRSPRTVRTPVELISLERAQVKARAMSMNRDLDDQDASMDELEASVMKLSLEHSQKLSLSKPSKKPMEISPPLHLEDDFTASYPGLLHGSSQPHQVYAPRADNSPPSDDKRLSMVEEEAAEFDASEEFDTRGAIQKYLDKAFSNHTHPLGVLMNQLETVFRESYGGIGANRFLLTHAIAEIHFIIRRLHSIIRILFPFLTGDDREVTSIGFTRIGVSDPDDYLSIESGYSLVHPLVFMRLFPTLITLYVLHHQEGDKMYNSGMEILERMDRERLVHYIHFPPEICHKIAGAESDDAVLRDLDKAGSILHQINTLYTPGEFLALIKSAFRELKSIKQLSGDVLLPAVVYIVVKARVPHLGAYLHFLTDFAHTQPEDEYILVTYEAAYNFIKRQNCPVSSGL